jgi:hypothetical protein
MTNLKLPVLWEWPSDKVRENTHTFANFSDAILEKMNKDTLTIHFHQWAITDEDFNNMPLLNRHYRKIATQVNKDNIRVVTVMEAFNYPHYSMIFHPEYRMMMEPNEDTLEFARSLS